jgi:hypothetical protein
MISASICGSTGARRFREFANAWPHAPVRIKARGFAARKPRASARRLFDEAVARAEAAINARIDVLVYEPSGRAARSKMPSLASSATVLNSVAYKHDVNDVNAPGPINRFLETCSMEGTIMTHSSPQAATTIPADDPARNFTLARSDNADLPHIGLVGDTYTILVAGKDTARPLLSHRHAHSTWRRPSTSSP